MREREEMVRGETWSRRDETKKKQQVRMLSDRILEFLTSRHLDVRLPKGIHVMNPYKDPYVFDLCAKFYGKYYGDDNPRTLIVGINPGRFGSGTTGISFTDPIKLEVRCGIANTLPKKPELSADFIYMMMEAFGGIQQFYWRYFISAVSPLGFTKEGLNINYYDDRKLEKAISPFVVDSFEKILSIGMSQKKCFCVGEGENFRFLSRLNQKHGWFEEIISLPHPRFIMQYRRKKLDEYVSRYISALTVA